MRKQLTGEPVAGELHTGFGGRGRRQPFPTPIETMVTRNDAIFAVTDILNRRATADDENASAIL